jgi:hypothetical protein
MPPPSRQDRSLFCTIVGGVIAAVIANLVQRLQHPLPVENLSAVTWTFVAAPQADCHRYDRLLTHPRPPEVSHATA